MDVNSMPAGPELDALVAEKVMGYVRATDIMVGTYWRRQEDEASFVFHPSSDIADAWRVVEKMKPVWGKFRLSYGPNIVVNGKLKDGWELEPAWCSPICGYGETAPMAICRAAINARKITK